MGRATKIGLNMGAGRGFVSVHLYNRHQGDRITNGTLWKLSVSGGAK